MKELSPSKRSFVLTLQKVIETRLVDLNETNCQTEQTRTEAR